LILTDQTELNFTDDEVVDFQWLSEQELQEFIDTREDYCSPLPLVFEKAKVFISDHL
jgi:isopentenyldiphosphate isomerase